MGLVATPSNPSTGGQLKVTILQWKKHNPRNDLKKPYWFKLDHGVFEDQNLFDLNAKEITVWIYFLCLASKVSCDTIIINYKHAKKIARLNRKVISTTIEKLIKSKVITAEPLQNLEQHASRIVQKRTIQNNTIQNTTVDPDPIKSVAVHIDYESLRQLFIERTVGIKIQQAWLDAFPEKEWVISEVRKAVAWETANPSRRKKNFGRFMTNWLTRSWDSRKVPNQTSGTFAQRMNENNIALAIRVRKGEV